jgi:hypothetical protein
MRLLTACLLLTYSDIPRGSVDEYIVAFDVSVDNLIRVQKLEAS